MVLGADVPATQKTEMEALETEMVSAEKPRSTVGRNNSKVEVHVRVGSRVGSSGFRDANRDANRVAIQR